MVQVFILLIVACLYIGETKALNCKRCFTFIDDEGQQITIDKFGLTESLIKELGLPEYTPKCKDASDLSSKPCSLQNITNCELYEATGKIASANFTMYYRDCPKDNCPENKEDFLYPFLKNLPFTKRIHNIMGNRTCCSGDSCNGAYSGDSCNGASSVALSLMQVFIMILIAM